MIGEAKVIDNIHDGVNIIGAPTFWSRGNKGENIIIAIIDTGCDITHPDLSDRILELKNFTDDDSSNSNIVTDYVGHDTHVAGIHGAIINAINNNILVVRAAGNSGDDNPLTIEISYPAAYNEVISVGSVNVNRQASRFSSSNNEVDLVAPGQGYGRKGILSTAPGGKYVEMQGTSMATPHVAGALALIINWAKIQFNRTLTESEIYAQLIRKTVSLGYNKNIEGNGMLYLPIDDIIAKIIKDDALLNSIFNK